MKTEGVRYYLFRAWAGSYPFPREVSRAGASAGGHTLEMEAIVKEH